MFGGKISELINHPGHKYVLLLYFTFTFRYFFDILFCILVILDIYFAHSELSAVSFPCLIMSSSIQEDLKNKLTVGDFNPSLNLMRSFFDDRLNRVKMGDATSDWIKMERGCPQGSSFGPLLWNIYQNDMSAHVKDVNLTMYADDHQMYVKGRKHKTVRCRMKTQGQQALSWYSNNCLLANPDKFQSLYINSGKLDKDKSDNTLSINDLDIANTELIKLLGVHIDENLKFTEHISILCTKASQKVGVLSRLRNLIPCKAKLVLHKPYLTYCHLTWHFCKSSDKRK